MSDDLKTRDLMEALEPVDPEPGSKLDRIASLFDEVASLLPSVDLEKISDEDLVRDDPVARIRRTYVLALNRLYQFLRNNFNETVTDTRDGEKILVQIPNAKAQIEQAKVALGYVRHLETTKLEALQLGKGAKDGALVAEVAKLRQEMGRLADVRGQLARDSAMAEKG